MNKQAELAEPAEPTGRNIGFYRNFSVHENVYYRYVKRISYNLLVGQYIADANAATVCTIRLLHTRCTCI